MKCPVCTTIDLVMSERSGIEIDYCPQCRGVWLDRGELDKIIERSMSVDAGQPVRGAPVYKQGGNDWGRSEHHRDHQHYEHGHAYQGKKPFWKELFD